MSWLAWSWVVTMSRVEVLQVCHHKFDNTITLLRLKFMRRWFIENLQRIHLLSYTKYYYWTATLLPLRATEILKVWHGILMMAIDSPDVISVSLYLAQHRGDSQCKLGSLGHQGQWLRVGVTITIVVVGWWSWTDQWWPLVQVEILV